MSPQAEIIMLSKEDLYICLESSNKELIPVAENALQSLPFFGRLSQVKRDLTAYYFNPRKYLPGEVIYDVGDEASDMFILLEGEVSRKIPMEQKRSNIWPAEQARWVKRTVEQHILPEVRLKPMVFFGEKEVIAMETRKERFVAVSEVILLALRSHHLHSSKAQVSPAHFVAFTKAEIERLYSLRHTEDKANIEARTKDQVKDRAAHVGRNPRL
jgi:CRP-like cAMP-binding protein